MSVCATSLLFRILTRQPPAVDEGSVPLWRFDIQEVEEHVEDDFLYKSMSDCVGTHTDKRTLVSNEGIRKQSTTTRIAALSLRQQYIRPTSQISVQFIDPNPVHTTPCTKHG